MAHSIVAAIARIKSEVAKWLTPEAIEQTAREVGHQWRDSLLDPVRTVHLFLLQILHGNTACQHVPRLGNLQCTGAAYCEARSRLPVGFFQRLLWRLGQPLRDVTDEEGRWRGHRTFHVDGSASSMPDTPELQARFGQPGSQKPGCGFPVMRLLALFHAGTGCLLQLVSAPLRTHDMAMVSHVHPQLQEGDILIADRGFYSFAHMAVLAGKKLHILFRLSPWVIVDFRPRRRSAKYAVRSASEIGLPTSRWVKRLGWHDQIVEYVKPYFIPDWMTDNEFHALPNLLRVRELRYQVRQRGFRVKEITLVTTLLDPDLYPAEAIAELYHQRWQIETNLRHMKQTMRMDVLHCKTVAGVEKELAMYALVYNLIRLVMLKASHEQQVALDRISFVDAVRWLEQALVANPPLQLFVNPHRPNRIEPRVLKRRRKPFNLMTKPRPVLRQLLLSQRDAA
jgi:hypothetical protein